MDNAIMQNFRGPMRGMTLPEVVLIAGLIMVVLAVGAGLYDHHLNRVKVRQVTVLIDALRRAAAAHAETAGAYPLGRRDDACDPALAVMQKMPGSAAQLQAAGSSLLFLSDGKLRCIDPWGLPLRYLTVRSELREHRRRVEANGGMPIFESAGPDRDFGDTNSARQGDNICSDDPT